ncbi:MAG: TetR/AcrR family transcriptional regulator [Pseudomonadota bacterium]
MPRKATFTPEDLTDRALQRFWQHGYHATSMDDLVAATRVSRHGIYTTFGGKKALFLACFGRYRETVVSPAFDPVEQAGADLAAVADYFETQIAAGEAAGLPGPGCFVANATTEVAPHDAETRAKVDDHNDRLRHGFRTAIENEHARLGSAREIDAAALADICVIFTTGLWSMSRSVGDAGVLRRAVRLFLGNLREALR